MAKKNYEFRPDRTGASLIDQLYLTRRQRTAILKWFLYGLVLLICSVAQDVMLSRVSIRGATTDLVSAAIFTVCVLEGADSGSLFCLIGALFYLFSGSGAGFHIIVAIPVLGVLVALFRQNYLRKSFMATFLCAGFALMAYELFVYAVALFFTQTTLARLNVALITGGLSVLSIPVLYPIAVSIGKIGGETWKE